MKKLISALLSLALVLGLIPFGALGVSADPVIATTDQKTWQVEDDGGTSVVPYGNPPIEDIKIKKTIEPVIKNGVPLENYFDITLELSSPPHETTHSGDIVLVFDISATMNEDHNGIVEGKDGFSGTSRIVDAKAAAIQFVEKMANHSGTHRIAIVTFATDVNVKTPFIECNNNTKNTLKNIINEIKAIETSNETAKYTNIEGGLKAAQGLFTYSSTEDAEKILKYIILLTDGFPTTYSKNGNIGYVPRMDAGFENNDNWTDSGNRSEALYNEIKGKGDGYFYDDVNQLPCTCGVDYSDVAAQKAENAANFIKESKINLFTIGLDIGSQSIPEYGKKIFNTEDKGKFTTLDLRGDSRVIGTGDYGDWLEKISGGPIFTADKDGNTPKKYWDANENTPLSDVYNGIISVLETVQRQHFREGTITDPMDENVEFLGFYKYINNTPVFTPATVNANEKKSQKLNGVYADYTNGGENEADFGITADNVITWNPVNYGWHQIGQTTDTPARPIYAMTLKYRVRLKNEATGFADDNDPTDTETTTTTNKHNTNGRTTFVYKDWNNTTHSPVDFPIPVVEGYLGEFEFYKYGVTDGGNGQLVADTTNPLEGAVFTLTHSKAGCTVCTAGGEDVKVFKGTNSTTATSAADGKVSFTNLPSGHVYTLKETTAPIGYKLDSTEYEITVSYNTVTVDYAISEGKISNKKLDPIEVPLELTKAIKDSSLNNRQFAFQLYYKKSDGTLETVGAPVKSDSSSGIAGFATLTFGPDAADNIYQVTQRSQTFDFVIKEILPDKNSADPKWYEEVLYNATAVDSGIPVSITITQGDTAYTAEVKYSGNTNLTVTNTLRPSVKLPLTVNKNFTDAVGSVGDINSYDSSNTPFKFKLYQKMGDDITEIAEREVTGSTSATFDPNDTTTPVKELVFNHSGNYIFYIEEVADPAIHQIVYDDTIYRIDVKVPQPLDAAGKPDNASPYTISEVVISTTNSVGGEKGDNVATYTLDNDQLVINSNNNDNIAQSADTNGNIDNISVSFENRERQEIKVPITILKSFDDAKPGNRLFKFKFTDENGNVQYITNNSNGDVQFANPAQDSDPATDDIYLFQRVYGGEGEKTYTYTVQEWEYMDNPNEKLVYDYSVYEVTIDISAPNKKGEESYQADVTIAKYNPYKTINDSDYARYAVKAKYDSVNDVFVYSNVPTDNGGKYNPVLTFANKTRAPASVYFSARKTLNFHKPGENDIFHFILIDATSGNDIVLMEKANDGYGVDFCSISYNSSGKRTYKVYERSGNDENITYDKSLYTIEVDVTVDITSDAPFKAKTTLYKNGNYHTDDEVPTFKNFKYGIPNTGDISNIALYGIIAAISGIALIVILRKKRRSSDR